MKYKILCTIYDIFADWARFHLASACKLGCNACCTRNVTISANEGSMILRYVQAENLSIWFSRKLAGPRHHRSALLTTNEFAAACREGQETNAEEHYNGSPCPFLENQLCGIYPARPFACRLFSSTRQCSSTQPALVPEFYIEAATAVSQLIEHLGQKEYWGNMLDVLPALIDSGEFQGICAGIEPAQIVEARFGTLSAKPLPGFLLSAENLDKVSPLLDALFSTHIEGKRLEDILNGK